MNADERTDLVVELKFQPGLGSASALESLAHRFSLAARVLRARITESSARFRVEFSGTRPDLEQFLRFHTASTLPTPGAAA